MPSSHPVPAENSERAVAVIVKVKLDLPRCGAARRAEQDLMFPAE